MNFFKAINNIVIEGMKKIEYGNALFDELNKANLSPLELLITSLKYSYISKLYEYEKQIRPKIAKVIETKKILRGILIIPNAYEKKSQNFAQRLDFLSSLNSLAVRVPHNTSSKSLRGKVRNR